ncbi:protein-disulfide reductase DsbD [Halomonas denitrificans]|nr:protein-disulfide reductase DsbD [Halomonas denitrificans]
MIMWRRFLSSGSKMRAGWAGLLLAAAPAVAQIDPADLLPVEQAFSLEAEALDASTVELRWTIADGYYMYRHAFGVEGASEAVTVGELAIDAGRRYEDEFFGEVEIYRERAAIEVPLVARPTSGPVELSVKFQGCADLGVCYPPHRQMITVDLPAAESAPADVSPSGPATIPPEPLGPNGSGLDTLLSDFSSAGEQLTGRSDPLLPEQAFRVETIALGPDRLLARFTTHPDYYLYRDTIEFDPGAPGVMLAAPEFPDAVAITDEYFGDTFVYYGEVEIPVGLSRPPGPAMDLPLEVRFQGCQTDGICYPPMARTLVVDVPAAPARPARGSGPVEAIATTDAAGREGGASGAERFRSTSSAPNASEQSRLAGALAERPVLALLLFFIAGILLAFTPCVFPMVPILSGLIAGDAERMTTARAFRLSLVYVLAMAVVYTAFGVIAAVLGENLQALFQHPAVLVAFALLFVLLSLAMFGFYELQLPSSWQTRLNALSNRAEGGTLWGAAIMGGLSALVVGPCVAPALMGALIYIGQTGDAVLGGGALFAMALGMGVPLVIWGTSAGKLLPRAGVWMTAVKAAFGVGLLALAIWMLERVLPGGVIMLMWGALALVSGVYLGAFNRTEPGLAGWPRLWQGLGLILVLFGAMQLIGAAAGGRDWTRPLEPFASRAASAPATRAVEFVEVDDLAGLERALQASTRPVFLDFYADWCVDCKRMERRTFPDPAVASALGEFDLLKIDLTDFNDAHREVLAEFGLIGPPAYLFFADGRELEAFRMFGFMAPGPFRDHLANVRAAVAR